MRIRKKREIRKRKRIKSYLGRGASIRPNSTPPLTRAAQTTKPAPTPGARLSVAGSARASDVWGSFVSSNSTEFPRALLCHIGPACRTADHAYHCPRDPTCHPGRAPTARADRTADLPVDIRSAPTDPPRPLKGARSRSSSPLFPRSHPSTASQRRNFSSEQYRTIFPPCAVNTHVYALL